MKSKILSTKKIIYIFLILSFVVLGYLYFTLKVRIITFSGELTYHNEKELHFEAQKMIKLSNLLFNNFSNFNNDMLSKYKEIRDIQITITGADSIDIKIKNYDLCCVINSYGNKFLVGKEGEILRKLEKEKIYNNEITLNQVISIGDTLNIESLKKIFEVENILIDREIEITKVLLEKEVITLVSSDGKKFLLDSETNLRLFSEKLDSILDHIKISNKEYSSLDFRFGNIILE